ncbi:MAG TPA: hypothetical protein VKS24_12700 [Bradyrhizobium sp.]|nr:hypothetical protein [Bradyrhizobium sp.]
MTDNDRPELTVDEGVAADANRPCVALVPVIPSAQRSPGLHTRWSPNSIFVTHLIATAEHVPQTCGLRRATYADAESAYHPPQSPARAAGNRMRQII